MSDKEKNDLELLKKRAKAVNVLTFLAFVYLFAGGDIGKEFNLLGGGISFSEPDILPYFACLFYWIIFYRYYVLLYGNLKNNLKEQYREAFTRTSLPYYMVKRLSKRRKSNEELLIEEHPELSNLTTEKKVFTVNRAYPMSEGLFYYTNVNVVISGKRSLSAKRKFGLFESIRIYLTTRIRFWIGMDESSYLFHPIFFFTIANLILIGDFITKNLF